MSALRTLFQLAALAAALLSAACTSHHHAPHPPIAAPEGAVDLPPLHAGLMQVDGQWRVVDVGEPLARGIRVDLVRRRPLAGYPCIHTDVGNWNPVFNSIGALGEGENVFADEGYCNLDVTCDGPWCHPELVTTRWKAPGASDPSYWRQPGAGHLPGTLVFAPVETALEAFAVGLLGYCSEVDCLHPVKFRRALAAGLENSGLDLDGLLAEYRRLLTQPNGVALETNLDAWASLLAARADLARRQFDLRLVAANFLAGNDLVPRDGTIQARPSPAHLDGPGKAGFRLRSRHFPDRCTVTAEVHFSVSQDVAFLRGGERGVVDETLWVGEGSQTFELGAAHGWSQQRQVSFGPILLREGDYAGVGGHETRRFNIDYRIEQVRLRCEPAPGQ